MKRKWKSKAAIICFAFCICLSAGGEVYSQKPKPVVSKSSFTAYLRTELFFGMDIPTGGKVSEDEWQKFVGEIVTPRFPEGFTVDDALGQYLDGKTLVREKSKQLILIYPRKLRSGSSRKIEEIRAAYIRSFNQKSVLRVDLPSYVLVSF
jgi:hypothetical protein